MASLFRYIIAWVFGSVYWLTFILFYLIVLGKVSDRWKTKVIRFWGGTMLKILKVRVELQNQSTLEDVKPRVVVCNHQSSLDLLWGAVISPPRILAIGKREVIYVPILNLIWLVFGFIRVDRGDTQKAVASLKGVAEEIKANSRSLVIAPEGTRTLDGHILPFKKGAFKIALQGQIDVYPLVVAGAFELMPKKSYYPRPGIIKLKFLPPISTSQYHEDDVDRLIDEVRKQMIQEQKELQNSLSPF